MSLITVITPTYNRGELLRPLFRSLQMQSCKDFEWLIVDDGSTDGTKRHVQDFLKEADFPVKYLFKENGGKHTAVNAGVEITVTELVFIVDSDDTVLPEGIATIRKYYDKYKNEANLGFFSFLKVCEQGILVKMPKDEYIASYVKERIKGNRLGDMAEVFFTHVLKENPFPVFENERFLSEDVAWIAIGLKYRVVFVNEPIYRFSYLEDGLTRNNKQHKFASPLGSMMRGKMLMNRECGFKANMKGAIIYDCYRREAGSAIPSALKMRSIREQCLLFLLRPVGLLFNYRWKKV